MKDNRNVHNAYRTRTNTVVVSGNTTYSESLGALRFDVT